MDLKTYLIIGVALLAILVILIVYSIFKKKKTIKSEFMDLIKSIHSPTSSSASWMRWASSFVLIFTYTLAYYQQYSVGKVQESLIIGLVGLALTGKVTQKYLENKDTTTKDKL